MKNLQRIACIWLPNWPLQRLTLSGEVPSHRNILLYEAQPQGGLKVAACSRKAKLAGVSVGMPLAEALALVDQEKSGKTAADCRLVQMHDAVVDRMAMEELANWCQQFSPTVSLEIVPQPSSLILDVTGISGLFGGEEKLAEHIQDAFAARRLSVRIAIAGSLGAAWALAHFSGQKIVVVKDTLQQNREAEATLLLQLPIASLRIVDETVECLEELGIYRIEQLVQLPRETLSSRLGTEVLLRLDQAFGFVPEALVAHRPLSALQVEWVLEHATDRREMINFVLESLVSELIPLLMARQEGVLRLECRMDLQSAKPLEFCVGLYRACISAKHLLGLLNLQLEKLRLQAPVIAIRLSAAATGLLEREQQELFAEEQTRASPHHLAILVDRLASRLGREFVLHARLVAEAQPEYACRYVPLAGQLQQRLPRKQSSRRKQKN